MTDQESINTEVREKLLVHDEKFNAIMMKMDADRARADEKFNATMARIDARVDATNQRIDDFISEMRDKDNQRAEDMREIRNSVSSIIKHVQVLTFTAMGAIAAMVITVLLK